MKYLGQKEGNSILLRVAKLLCLSLYVIKFDLKGIDKQCSPRSEVICSGSSDENYMYVNYSSDT